MMRILFFTFILCLSSAYGTPDHCFKVDLSQDYAVILDFIPDKYSCSPDHVVIPTEIKWKKVAFLALEAFYNKGIKKITLGRALRGISDYQFVGNMIEGAISIPESVKYVGKNAFKGNKIERVYINTKSYNLKEIMCFYSDEGGRHYESFCYDEDGDSTYDQKNPPLEVEEGAFANNVINKVKITGTPILKKNVFTNNKIDTLKMIKSYTSFFDMNINAFTDSLADSVNVTVDHPCNDLKKLSTTETTENCPEFYDFIYKQ